MRGVSYPGLLTPAGKLAGDPDSAQAVICRAFSALSKGTIWSAWTRDHIGIRGVWRGEGGRYAAVVEFMRASHQNFAAISYQRNKWLKG